MMRGSAAVQRVARAGAPEWGVRPGVAGEQQALPIARLRQKLVDAGVARDDRLTAVLQALKKIPSAAFLPPPGAPRAIPAGDELVSVAFMAALLRARKEEPVLQIGFGSGYETAILARISRAVLVEEEDSARAQAALARLARLGVGNVRWTGEAEADPAYSSVFLTGTALDWPQGLAGRLRSGGRLVARIGGAGPVHFAQGQKRRDGTLRISCYAPDTLRPIGLPSR